MVKANFNAYNAYVTDSLYQWDINQVLTVSGLNLSVAPEVHFSNANTVRAIVRQATLNNGVINVSIPNSVLQDPLPIYAYIGVYSGSTFKVIEYAIIPVIPRKRPTDYQIEDSDEEIYSFKALENALANKADNARIDNIIAHNNDTDGNTELLDLRVGYDGKSYPSGGAAARGQNENIVDTLTRSGLYSERVLTGETKTGKYAVKDSGYIKETEQSTRGVVVYDVSAYAGKYVQIFSVANSETMFIYALADVNGKVLSTEMSGVLEYKNIILLPADAYTLYVNFGLTASTNNNVLVKVIDTLALPEKFEKLTADLQNTNFKLDTLVKNGTLELFLTWEMGGISTLGEIYSPDDIRIRTAYYYKPIFNSIKFIVPEGYRMLAVLYTYSEDTGEYTYSRHRGYFTGSGEFEINEGEYIRFVLRGVDEITFTGDEYKLLTLYHESEAFVTEDEVKTLIREYHPDNVPDYWLETITAKEQVIKQIIYNAASRNQDIAAFFTIADPHYPDNTGVSTSLINYLGKKCGIGLTVCLGDLIADSKISRDDGLARIRDGMVNLGNMSDRAILTQGNHDTNIQITDDAGQISAERIVYDGEWILHTNNRLLGLNKIVFDDLGKAFYYDDDILKIRFISLDSFEGKTYTIDNGILKSLNLGRMTERQVNWLMTVALATVPNNYSVITFSHLALTPPYVSNGNDYVSLNVGAMGNGSLALQAIRQFIGNGGKYIGHFAGHLHHDFISDNDGIVSVHSLNDGIHWRDASYFGDYASLVGDSPLKVAGTVNECAFDVVLVNKTARYVDLVRIGAGDKGHRHFSY